MIKQYFAFVTHVGEYFKDDHYNYKMSWIKLVMYNYPNCFPENKAEYVCDFTKLYGGLFKKGVSVVFEIIPSLQSFCFNWNFNDYTKSTIFEILNKDDFPLKESQESTFYARHSQESISKTKLYQIFPCADGTHNFICIIELVIDNAEHLNIGFAPCWNKDELYFKFNNDLLFDYTLVNLIELENKCKAEDFNNDISIIEKYVKPSHWISTYGFYHDPLERLNKGKDYDAIVDTDVLRKYIDDNNIH